MKMRKLDTLGWALLAWGAAGAAFVACSPGMVDSGSESSTGNDATTTSMTTTGGSTGTNPSGADEESGDNEKLDLSNPGDTDNVQNCVTDGSCDLIDILFVIDNSGTMGEEQLNLANNFQQLINELENLKDPEGNDVNPNVNIMVTTSDFGHPLCTQFFAPDYQPRKGAPVYQGCNARINRFTGVGEFPVQIPEACTQNCPADIAPGNHFINFGALGSNVPNDDVGAALSCIGPQGIDGCGFEAPLESMLQGINVDACWNNPNQEICDEQPEWADTTRGFLREDAILVVAIITDEMDCSVRAPGGFSYFTDATKAQFWELDPKSDPEMPMARPTSAICFNAGVECTDDNNDGLYENCATSTDAEAQNVLHPVSRYTQYFDFLKGQGKDIVMLGILGVPEVVAHNPLPPFQPTAGGAIDLLYRKWIDFPYPNGDILPSEWEAAEPVRAENKIFEFGEIGPGCTGQDEMGSFTGQAIPPVRIKEVCEHLNTTDPETGEPVIRCCIESICDTDFSPAIRCLTGVISEALGPIG